MTTSNKFGFVPINKKSTYEEPPIKSDETSQNHKFGFTPLKKESKRQEESALESGFRQITAASARGLERVLGMAGDWQSIADSITKPLVEKLYPTTESQKEILGSLPKIPTTETLRGKTKELTGEYLEPRGRREKAQQEGADFAASLFGPVKFRKALGAGLASQLAKEGVVSLGGGKGAQEAVRLGTALMITARNPNGAKEFATKGFKKAEEIAADNIINVATEETNLLKMLGNLHQGIPTSEKNTVIKAIEPLIAKMENGSIKVTELMAAKKDINSIMREPETLKGAKKLLKGVAQEVDRGLKQYGKTNPEFKKVYEPANEMWGAIAEGNKIQNYISKVLGKKSVLLATVGEAAFGHPGLIPKTMGIVGTVRATAKTADFMTRLYKSPALQKYYTKAMSAAAKQDAAALRFYSEKIEEEMEWMLEE